MLSSFGGSHKKFELPPVDSRWSIQLMRCGPSPALQAGFCAASFSAPADALMTEYQSSSDGGLLRSAGNMLRKRGPAAFVRGWTANFCRHPCLMKPKVTRGSAF
eukprot:s6815_g5.t1